jgi:ABC-type transport system involved in multi-copper enzyme maturation permease subunit
MVDFSIFAISIFNIFIGIFIGASVVYDDIEKKSVFLTITRPLKRTEYLIGRFLGLASAIIFSTIIMMLIFYAVLLIMHKFIVPVGYSAGNVKDKFIFYSLPQPLIIQALFIITESIFIASAALLFSLITSKALASIFAILVFFIGNISGRMNDLIMPVKKIINGKIVVVHQANHILAAIVNFIYTVLPNFSIFNISSEAAYKVNISTGAIFYRIIYGLSYTILLFIASSFIFAKKDIS